MSTVAARELAQMRMEVAALHAKVDAILRALEQQHPAAPTTHTTHVSVVLALAAAVGDRAFSAREVVRHAALVDGALRAALDVAGLSRSGRKLGKWLRRVEGRTIAGVRLERIGLDRDGVIWRVFADLKPANPQSV